MKRGEEESMAPAMADGVTVDVETKVSISVLGSRACTYVDQ
jgi:hypothetical protein